MAMGSNYVVKDTMHVHINEVSNTIQLCLGDISTLAESDKVDILLISAIPDSYLSAPGTVIHALQENLNVSVADLAMNKAADMRERHKCWLSRPLDRADVPFDRLMCFESGTGEVKASEFNNARIVFSSLKDIFHQQDCTVATVLLNTGRQGANEADMLEATVETAIIAMEEGLKLRRLMIFVNDKYKPRHLLSLVVLKRDPSEIYAKFNELKSLYEAHARE